MPESVFRPWSRKSRERCSASLAASLAPSLADSPRLDSDPAQLVPVLLHGLTGPLDGKTYQANFMAPGSALGLRKDREYAAVLSYLSFKWGSGEEVSEPQVAKTKAATRGRKLPWTQAELEKTTSNPPWQE